MAEYIIYEHIKTTNIYTLDLNDKLIQKLNSNIQKDYVNEQGRTIPHIDLDTLIEILAYRGELDKINADRAINHKSPLEPFEVQLRNFDTFNWSLYDIILDMINDYTRSSSQIEELESYVDDWYGELDERTKIR